MTAQGKVLRSAAGKLYLQRPGKFRWDYAEPSEQLVLADGKQIWFYDKDLAQANVRDMDATLGEHACGALVGDRSVSSSSTSRRLPDERRFALVSARPQASGYGFSAGAHRFRQGRRARAPCSSPISSNQITQLTFTTPSRIPSSIPDLFTFSPPPGVDVIGRDSK